MYSDNDYRYYLEHRLAMSDDFLAHYGVKGMKWKHKKNLFEETTSQLSDAWKQGVKAWTPDKKRKRKKIKLKKASVRRTTRDLSDAWKQGVKSWTPDKKKKRR